MAQPQKYLITGLKEVSGVQPRLNINEFMASNSMQWNLFVAAMRAFHDMPEDDLTPLGFYQVAGIHGAPYINWMELPEPGDRPFEYCTHGTALFLTWHRPYLLLLEQRIVEEAAKIAEDLGSDYQEAARTIRIPYWDWANNSDVPEACRDLKISYTLPDPGTGKIVTTVIDNPFYSYAFKSQSRLVRDFQPVANVDGPPPQDQFLTFMETKRCPDQDGNSRPDVVNYQLKGNVPPNDRLPTDWKPGMYRLLLSVENYGDFSNTGFKNDQGTPSYHSLESYHNSIHNYTGTDYSSDNYPLGHMTEVAVSAFDPIFWLHHCNIDRMYALWQAIHYEADFQDQKAATDRLPEVAEASQDSPDTVLRPFYFKQPDPGQVTIQVDCVWNNTMIQKSGTMYPSVVDFGYTYPEIPADLAGNPEKRPELSEYVRQQVNQLYGPVKLGSVVPRTHAGLVGVLPKLPALKNAQFRREWVANVHVKKYLVPGNFTIFVFLGEPEEDKTKWITSPHLAGTLDTFKAPSEFCINCATQKETDVSIGASIDLTNILYNQATAEGLGELHEESKMVAYIKENLHWRLMKRDRTVVDLEPLVKGKPDALEVSVASFYMSYPEVLAAPGAPLLPIGDAPGGVLFGEKKHHVATEAKHNIGGYKV